MPLALGAVTTNEQVYNLIHLENVLLRTTSLAVAEANIC